MLFKIYGSQPGGWDPSGGLNTVPRGAQDGLKLF